MIEITWIECILVMGPGQKILTRVGSTFSKRLTFSVSSSDGSGSKTFDKVSGKPFMVWVWIWKIFPKNITFFNFFPFGSKNFSLGWVKKYPGQGRVSHLFTAGQK